MNLLVVVTPPSLYHGYFTRKKLSEKLFTPVKMKNCDRCNVRKHREIKNGEKYITLDISLDFGSLDKTKITYSELKEYWVRSGKVFKTIRRF